MPILYPTANEQASPEETRTQKLYNLVHKNMTHKCALAENGCINKNGECKRGYHKTTVSQSSSFDNKGFPIYCRLCEDDLKIVPHCPEILLDWDGHANIEWSGSAYTCVYLYKYLFKGSKKEKFALTNADDIHDKDEINLYLRGRMLCSMDACWRVLGYHTYPKAIPAVRILKIKLPQNALAIQQAEKICDLTMYFLRPNISMFDGLKYTEFFNQYVYNTKLPLIYANAPNLENTEWFQVRVSNKIYYYFKRKNYAASITRMHMLYINAGEIWYLRLLLLNKPARSFRDLLTVRNKVFQLFQQAAIAEGYCSDKTECERSFRDAAIFSTPSELRMWFVVMTVNGFPTSHIFYNKKMHEQLKADFIHNYPLGSNDKLSENDMLLDLAKRLADENKTLSQYGFPEPKNIITELDEERFKYDPMQQTELLKTLNASIPNTKEQNEIFLQICDDISFEKTAIHFVQAQAGSGKSMLANKLMAFARSLNKIALGCASTGLAANNFEGFYTAHALYALPVVDSADLDEIDQPEYASKLHESKYKQRLQLIQASSLHVWDEFPSNHRNCFEAAYQACNKFEGKVVVCFGDFRQIAPVVEGGTKQEIINACIQSSEYWKYFRIHILTKNMRLEHMKIHCREELTALESPQTRLELTDQEFIEKQITIQKALDTQIAYGEMILALGNNQLHSSPNITIIREDRETSTSYVSLPLFQYIIASEEGELNAIRWLHPQGFDASSMHKRAVLAATNDRVDMWNSLIQSLNPKEAVSLRSHDFLCEVDDPRDVLSSMLSDDVLNRYNNNGVPRNNLQLKIGDICLLLRTISKKDGLTTNARVRITNIKTFCVQIQTLTYPPRSYALPRIRFKFQLPFGQSYQMVRTQFPLRLAYALSVNKSQGQEFDKVLYDIVDPAFSHGHTYVASSRIRHFDTIKIYCDEDKIHNGAPILPNVVYDELLRSIL